MSGELQGSVILYKSKIATVICSGNRLATLAGAIDMTFSHVELINFFRSPHIVKSEDKGYAICTYTNIYVCI